MKTKRIIPVLALAAFCAASASAAEVKSIKAEAAAGFKVSGDDVLVRCEVKPGSEYDPAVCARDVKALRDSGEFDDIEVKADMVDGGVAVVYVLKPKTRFQGPLHVRGCEYWGEGKIGRLAELKDGYAYGEADYAAAAGRVLREYRKRFFTAATVKHVVEPVAGLDNAVSVTFEIVEGEQRKIDAFEFTGNDSVDADELRASFDQYPWWNPLGWFTEVPATEQDFSDARDKVAARYRELGNLDVEVSMPEEKVDEKGRIFRVFKVTEGPRYRVGRMRVTGMKNYPEEAALAAVKSLHRGDVAGSAALTAAAREIEIFCGSGQNPLAETKVEVRQLPTEDAATLDLEFHVTEGVPVRVNRVVVRGNDYTKDKVIRREISLSPGDRMLDDRAERSKRRLENLRYFERVRYYLEKTDDPAKPGEPELRDLVYEVEEKNTGNFMIGLGAGSESSVFGQVELSESNFDLFNPWRFRGAGQKGRITVQAGPRVQVYEVSVTEPYLFDRLLELTTTVYRRQNWYDDYDVIRNGISATLTYPMKLWNGRTFGRFGTRLALEYIEMDDVDNGYWYLDEETGDNADAEPKRRFRWERDEYADAFEIPLRVFWEDDTRDKFLFPTRGHRVNVFGEIAGGDNEYWRCGFNVRQYWTTWKKWGHVLSVGLRGETIDTFSNEYLPIYDRLFLGGSRTIRGVDYREIAPRVYRNADKRGHYAPWGGQTSWCGTAEYSVPVVKVVRLAAFTDFGSVGRDEFDFDTDWFCWSVGVGVRLDIEQFPIRLDLATPVVDPDEDVDKQVFSFSVGYDF